MACRLRFNADVKGKLLSSRTLGCWRFVTEQKERTGGLNHAKANRSNRTVFHDVPALCQSTSKYQAAFITEVKPRRSAGDSGSDPTSYDVSVKVSDTIYVGLYTALLGELNAKYATGRELLVLVGKNTITYNDMLGQSLQVPIESQRPVMESKRPK